MNRIERQLVCDLCGFNLFIAAGEVTPPLRAMPEGWSGCSTPAGVRHACPSCSAEIGAPAWVAASSRVRDLHREVWRVVQPICEAATAQAWRDRGYDGPAEWPAHPLGAALAAKEAT